MKYTKTIEVKNYRDTSEKNNIEFNNIFSPKYVCLANPENQMKKGNNK